MNALNEAMIEDMMSIYEGSFDEDEELDDVIDALSDGESCLENENTE